ncbi:HTH domain-containing protein [Staphylothermus hellenicus]|uniref:Transcriptional antiterminator, BglG n=1 Tax=Staphylothermus hellenicus (strain DSM 12710 / JCM 10830 / BK20S6-10-b1 / P8) TaxID=591019 RepID=D7D8T8_STAHD|nr:HTH domain-containing protein [Staphylothermus hellenicus]ADI32184.1 transcriptional antiterminator, BglG [Staphylothermus hellenicus DSM 12710]
MKQLYFALLKHREISIKDLSELLGLNERTLYSRIKELRKYITIVDDKIILGDPLSFAIQLLKQGYSFKDVTKYLDWHDFERFSAEILGAHKYFVKTNFRLTKPVRLEIDVIGVDMGSGRGIFIDCKHWIHGIGRKTLMGIAEKHFERVKKFIKHYSWAKPKWTYFRYLRKIVPLIVTLTTPSIRMYENVLIVSIQELNSTLLDLDMVLDLFGIEPIPVS